MKKIPMDSSHSAAGRKRSLSLTKPVRKRGGTPQEPKIRTFEEKNPDMGGPAADFERGGQKKSGGEEP